MIESLFKWLAIVAVALGLTYFLVMTEKKLPQTPQRATVQTQAPCFMHPELRHTGMCLQAVTRTRI